jgi:tRNA(fMet)-specific endonuclease VapC
MLQFLFDTDHLTLFQRGHPLVGQRLALQPVGAVGISVVSIEESLRGRLAQVARAADGPARIHCYALLEETVVSFAQFPVAPFDRVAEAQFQQLRSHRIGTMDRKIASIAVAQNVILLTRNRRDFAQIPGLRLEDWSE